MELYTNHFAKYVIVLFEVSAILAEIILKGSKILKLKIKNLCWRENQHKKMQQVGFNAL
jgi:hypothetical protein